MEKIMAIIKLIFLIAFLFILVRTNHNLNEKYKLIERTPPPATTADK
jgi:uncharacterized membrane protein